MTKAKFSKINWFAIVALVMIFSACQDKQKIISANSSAEESASSEEGGEGEGEQLVSYIYRFSDSEINVFDESDPDATPIKLTFGEEDLKSDLALTDKPQITPSHTSEHSAKTVLDGASTSYPKENTLIYSHSLKSNASHATDSTESASNRQILPTEPTQSAANKTKEKAKLVPLVALRWLSKTIPRSHSFEFKEQGKEKTTGKWISSLHDLILREGSTLEGNLTGDQLAKLVPSDVRNLLKDGPVNYGYVTLTLKEDSTQKDTFHLTIKENLAGHVEAQLQRGALAFETDIAKAKPTEQATKLLKEIEKLGFDETLKKSAATRDSAKIGKGSSGQVYKMQYEGKEFAVKETDNTAGNRVELSNMIDGVCPSCLPYYGAVQKDGKIYLISELAVDRGSNYSASDMAYLFRQAKEMARQGKTHLDLKPDNILWIKVQIDGKDVYLPVIIDHGVVGRNLAEVPLEGTATTFSPEQAKELAIDPEKAGGIMSYALGICKIVSMWGEEQGELISILEQRTAYASLIFNLRNRGQPATAPVVVAGMKTFDEADNNLREYVAKKVEALKPNQGEQPSEEYLSAKIIQGLIRADINVRISPEQGEHLWNIVADPKLSPEQKNTEIENYLVL